jgi:hypothetical protein
VPEHTARPPQTQHEPKNFIRSNAIDVILADPSKRSVEQPSFRDKPTYGAVPAYIQRRRAEEEHAAAAAQHAAATATNPHVRLLDDDERGELLAGLKAQWDKIHHAYQGMSLQIDTVMKKQRKERMEAQMKILEADIAKLEGIGRKAVVVVD